MSDRTQDVEGAGDAAFQDAVDIEDPQGVESLSTTESNVETTFMDPGPTGGARTNVEVAEYVPHPTLKTTRFFLFSYRVFARKLSTLGAFRALTVELTI